MNVLIRFLTACLTICIFITLLIFSSSTTNAIELVGPNSKKPSKKSEIYGPVKGTDTLWRIALNNRPDSKLTIDQVMIAIFMANPQAFKNNDIHSITDGSLITIPSAKDIATISDQDAKRRIANNAQLKTNVTPVQAPVQPVVKTTPVKVTPKVDNPTVVTSPVPKVEIIETTTTPVADEPQEVAIEKPVEIDKSEALKTHLALAMTDMQLLIKENEELRTQISGLDEKLTEMQIQESLDIQAHDELDQLKQELDSIELAKDTEHESIFNNGWVIALLSSIPAIALLGGLFFWLTRRYKGNEEVVVLETTTPLDLEDEDELLNEEGILSDDLDDSLLISDDDELLEIDNADDSSELDDDGLFSDGEELLIPSEDDEDDGLFSDGEEEETDNSSILAQDDLEALLSQADDLENDTQENTDLSDEIINIDDLDSSIEESNELPDDDIDALLDQANDDALSEESNESIDDLLTETDAIIDELEPDVVNDEDFGESIDDLLAQTDVLVEQETIDDNNIESDDIDSLLEETNDLVEDTETDTLIEENNDSVDDIDSLLAETESIVEEDHLDVIDEQEFGESIDDLLAQTDELIEEENLDDINIDDVDSLLAETDAIVEDENSELSDVDIDNIDELLTDTDTLLESEKVEQKTSKLEELSNLDNVEQPYLMTQEQEVNFFEPETTESVKQETAEVTEPETTESVEQEVAEVTEPEATESVEQEVAEITEPEATESVEQEVAEVTEPEATESVEQEVAEVTEPETTESVELEIAEITEPETLAPSQEAKHLVDALDGMLASSNAQATNTNINELDEFITPQAIEVNDNELTDIMAEFDESNVITDSVDSTASELDDFLANKDSFVQDIPEPETPLIEVEQDLNEQLSKFEEENSFIDIDKLLNDSAMNEQDNEPYQHVDLDMGLDEFPEIIPETNGVDVDDDPNGASKKLDLARAYLEIDDEDSALEILKQIEESGDKVQQKEAKKLLKRLKS